MDTKKCNKCGKVKPLPEMTRRRDEETGEFKCLSLCKSCKAEYQKKHKIEKREAPKSKVCTCCKQEKPIDSFYKKYPNSAGIWVYTSQCKECKRAAYRAKHGSNEWSNPRGRSKKPSVWDLMCMPKGLSVEDTVNLSNEAFPLLGNQYWKTGEAQKIYKQFGRKWSYL